MNKLILISLIISIIFCQTHTDAVCAGTEVGDGTHLQLKIDSADKCILIGAVENIGTFSDAIEADGVVSGNNVGSTLEISFTITDPSDCGSGTEACFKPEFYSISLKNKNDQDAAEPSGTLLSSKVVIDETKLQDTTNWCNTPDPVTGVIECPITANYSFTGITGSVIHTIPVTVEMTQVELENPLQIVVEDTITVDERVQEPQEGIENEVWVGKQATLSYYTNDAFDTIASSSILLGDYMFLQVTLDSENDQTRGPFSTTNYDVFLLSDMGNQININKDASNPQSVNIGSPGADNHVFRIKVQMNFVGSFDIKVVAFQPNSLPGRILEEVKQVTQKNVARSFLSVTVLPEK